MTRRGFDMRASPSLLELSRGGLARPLLLLVVTLASSSAVSAGVCDRGPEGLPMGPVPFSLQFGELAQPRDPCPSTGLWLAAEGQAIIRAAEFYGNLGGNVVLGGSYAVSDRLELSATFEPLLFQQVISSLSASYLGLGHGALGTTLVLVDEGTLVLSATARTTVPFAFGLYNNAWPVGFDAGLVAALQPSPWFRPYAQVLGVGSFLLSAGDPYPRAGLLALGGAELILFEWVALVGELKGLALYEADLDHVSASGALRTRIWDGFGAELYATAPVAGRDRTLAGFGARVSWQL